MRGEHCVVGKGRGGTYDVDHKVLVPRRSERLLLGLRLENLLAIEREDAVRVRLAAAVDAADTLAVDERNTENTHVCTYPVSNEMTSRKRRRKKEKTHC